MKVVKICRVRIKILKVCMTDDEFLKELGHLLKFYRIKRGITQFQLSEMVEISEHRISQIENGKCNLTLKTTNKIFQALKISPFKIFQIDDIK